MAPMVVERWEAKDGLGPYTTRQWPVEFDGCEMWSSDLNMTDIRCPENDGIGIVMFPFLCGCVPTNPAWTERDKKILKKAKYRHMRYAVLPKYVVEGNCQVVFDSTQWMWKERV